MSLGLLAGLSRGLMAGMDSYRTERKRSDDLAREARDQSLRENRFMQEVDDAKDSRKVRRAGLLLDAENKGFDVNLDADEPKSMFSRSQRYLDERNEENRRKAAEDNAAPIRKALADEGFQADFDADGRVVPGSRRKVVEPYRRPVTGSGGAAAGLTPFQKAVDVAAAKHYADQLVGGAASSVATKIGQLKGVAEQLRRGEPLTGPDVGSVPMLLRRLSDPASVQAQETVEQAVQDTLRQTLGAQFTAKEGEQVISRAYNPSLPPQMVAARVDRLIRQLDAAQSQKRAAFEHLEKYQTLQGFAGVKNMAELEANLKNMLLNDVDIPNAATAAAPAGPAQSTGWSDADEKRLQELEAKFGGK